MRIRNWMITLACVAGYSMTASAWAAEHVVEMLDQDDGASMVFKPMYLKVEQGDKVTFKPTHKSHYVKLMTAPEGVAKFTSKEDESYTVTVDKPGVYFYVCPPHMMMAMIGAIQVGQGEEVRAQVPAAVKTVNNLRGRMMSNADRADVLVQKMQEVQ
ncbi:plastocyanin/azurin family copper-binding protein [Comamonas kerstersii]|uniref:plastocyanin/azurin family copper-binding protein n=1 Tax=Comamonas kerstersii TaxID=225992 RepID=UPI00215D1DBA|nr:plastocyanin/azurin family copper-binding protein [Comamonas kerstersii]